ncbi:hypothetical protein GCM10023086_58840 [Streptomyces venetus]|uniref:Tn3 transposase DDE domain-containing protein n=1 Tax=Streptomyces venetus TaxID=1701086 RepID=A0ABP8GTB1_9ACTN
MRGTPHDGLYTLDTLNLDGGVKPELMATDNASHSDMAFGLYKMLGFPFAPRFRDLADQRFWRTDLPGGEVPAGIRATGGHRPQQGQPEAHRDTLAGHRVAGSLITNQVRAADLLRMLGREGHPAPPGQAFAAYGRIDKTMHLLADRLTGLGLVLNAVVLRNTRYLDVAVAQLRVEGPGACARCATRTPPRAPMTSTREAGLQVSAWSDPSPPFLSN